jgi:hypothetical protein
MVVRRYLPLAVRASIAHSQLMARRGDDTHLYCLQETRLTDQAKPRSRAQITAAVRRLTPILA